MSTFDRWVLTLLLSFLASCPTAGQPLDEDYWHVTDYYDNIRKKVRNLDPSLGHCYKINGTLPTRMCNTPMQVRYRPRVQPEVFCAMQKLIVSCFRATGEDALIVVTRDSGSDKANQIKMSMSIVTTSRVTMELAIKCQRNAIVTSTVIKWNWRFWRSLKIS